MRNQHQRCLIDGFKASNANRVVLIRTGPSDQHQMLTWNLDTDEITEGQWLKGKLNSHACNLSPDGKHMIVSAINYARLGNRSGDLEASDYDGWIAVSKPPFFSALAAWAMPVPGAENGAYWTSNESLVIEGPTNFEPARSLVKPHKKLRVEVAEPLIDEMAWLEHRSEIWVRQRYQGWSIQYRKRGDFEISKSSNLGTITAVSTRHGKPWCVTDHRNRTVLQWDGADALKYGHTTFADFDDRGRFIFADQGCLYALTDFDGAQPTMIADLSQNRFAQIPPPDWALEW